MTEFMNFGGIKIPNEEVYSINVPLSSVVTKRYGERDNPTSYAAIINNATEDGLPLQVNVKKETYDNVVNRMRASSGEFGHGYVRRGKSSKCSKCSRGE